MDSAVPPQEPTVLSRLRDATRARHDALDASVDVTTPEKYQRFLAATLAAIEGIEPHVAPLLGERVGQRTDALREDLKELGVTAPAGLPFEVSSPSAVLGAAYVLEGSTLGGMVLAERVSSFTTSTRFLRIRGKETMARWREFLAMLERDATDRDEACAGALAAFDHYERAFKLHCVTK